MWDLTHSATLVKRRYWKSLQEKKQTAESMAGKTVEIQTAYLLNTAQSWSISNDQAQSELY
jgi:hypothetical protein